MILSRKKNILLIIFFVAILLMPILDNIFNFSPIQNLFEKRFLASIPEKPRNVSEFAKYSKKFEEFFNDNYGFRKSLIFTNSQIMDNIFNESPSSSALIGKDEWFYFDNQNSFLDAQGLAKLDDQKIALMVKSFIKNWQILRAKNIDYLVVIAADKTSIYPEFLPDFIKISNKEHRIDKFINALKKDAPSFPVLDLRPFLKKAKKHEIIYHKTDAHWNKRGAYVGYSEIMQKMNHLYLQRKHFVNVEGMMDDGDISYVIGIKAENIDYNLKENFVPNFYSVNPTEADYRLFHKPAVYRNYNKNLPILFVYKDSFFDNMMEFFANNFSQSYFVNEFPCDLNIEIIQKYRANIVIQQFWEGRIEEVANECGLDKNILEN